MTGEDTKADYDKKYSNIQGEGLIKTRSQREAELLQAKQYEQSQKVDSTFDADSVWAMMKDEGLSTVEKNQNKRSPSSGLEDGAKEDKTQSTDSRLKEEYVTIKKVYKFAGKVEVEEKQVLKSSDEAIAYFKSQDHKNSEIATPENATEKNTDTNTSELGVKETGKKRKNSASARKGPVKRRQGSLLDELNSLKPKKLNTLEKSKLDWLGYVDQAGIKDELTLHNKDGYLTKKDFLSRVENRVESNFKSNMKR